jgi:hypothetical protein
MRYSVDEMTERFVYLVYRAIGSYDDWRIENIAIFGSIKQAELKIKQLEAEKAISILTLEPAIKKALRKLTKYKTRGEEGFKKDDDRCRELEDINYFRIQELPLFE